MTMIMMIDTLAERYGLLPSEVVQRASTFDLFVADAAIGYRNLMTERANNPNAAPNYKQEDLIKILKESRGEQ